MILVKKLLTWISAITLVASSSVLAISCKTEQVKNENSLFLTNFGDIKIDSKSLLEWNQKWNGISSNNQELINKTNNLLAAGILLAIRDKKLHLPTDNKDGWDSSVNKQIESLLGNKNSTDTATLYGLANKSLNDLKDNKYKNDPKGWKKHLEETFPGVKKNLTDLENAYKSNFILNDSSNSAFIKLKNLLMFNSTVADSMWQKGIQTTNLDWKTLTSNFANAYPNKNSLDELAKAVKEAFTNADKNWNDAKIITFTNIVNGLGGISDQQITSTGSSGSQTSGQNDNLIITYSSSKNVKNKITTTNSGQGKNGEEWIKEILNKISDNADKGSVAFSQWSPSYNYDSKQGPKNFINYNNQKPQSWTEIVKQIPVLENGDLKRDSIKGEYGAISNSQKYAINNYFNSEKPVVFSDLIFKFANNKTSSDIEKNLSLKALIPTESSGQDLTTKLIERFQGIQAVLETYINSDQTTNSGSSSNGGVGSESNNSSIYTAGLSRFDTIFRGEVGKIKANASSNKSSDYKTWIDWDTKNEHHKINASGKLLTLSDTTYSDTVKFSIYDFLTNNNNNNNNNLWKWNSNGSDNGGMGSGGSTTNGSLDSSNFKKILTDGGLSSDEANKIDSAIEKTSGQNQIKDATRLTIYNLAELFKKINQKNNNHSEGGSGNSGGSSSSGSSSSSSTDGTNNGVNKNSNVYAILNKDEGIIAFIDGDGLHITKIDGYKLINNKENNSSSTDSQQQENDYSIKQTAVLKQIRSLYSSSNANVLIPYLINSTLENNKNNLTNGATSTTTSNNTWDWSQKDKEYSNAIRNLGIDINSLNKIIKNDYERFLVNISLIDNSKTKPFYNVDILSEVSKSIQSGNDNSSQTNWLIELFTKILKNGNQNQTIDLLKTIITTDDKSNTNNEIEKIFSYQARNLKVSGIRKLQQSNQKWVNKVKENYKKYSKDPSLDKKFIPDQVIDLNSMSNDKKRYDLLLQSQIFNSEVKAQTNTTSSSSSGRK
ncbi:lipoprotein, putative [Mycoplasma capricolum subsp. capricolum ATCC 27343]|uniref:Lipoprotein, putative n=1 Tax=Mycoplasma capricolum subsp. capricolum (strain California kid / ATCC 27343 / NCTC 10154) TaxID=340047 RepID=Q2SS19_MYCCT|nr:lipoprotein [Mycoplasma capricolum]ABC01249.1 lipoprotein, putative [Mycoplasma capricolum subsp. capricolum ATCC 27343]